MSNEDINVVIDSGSIQYGQLSIGTTTTGEAGTEASVTNSGSEYNAVLNFTIPRGDKGDTYTITQADKNEIKNEATAELQSQINALASGSPLVASSTEDMTDTSKIYVNTSDGNWYYHNGSEWVIGGIYQATLYSELIQATQIPLNITGFIKPTDGNLNSSNGFLSSDYIEVNENMYVSGSLHQVLSNLSLVAFYNDNQDYISSYWGEDAGNNGLINFSVPIPENVKYIRVSSKVNVENKVYLNINAINYINSINEDIKSKEFIDLNITGYINERGIIKDTGGFFRSDYIPVQFGEYITGKLYQVEGNISVISSYDNNKNLISLYLGDGTDTAKLIDVNYPVPLNAKYVIISSSKSDMQNTYAYISSNTKNLIATINTLKNKNEINFIVDKNTIDTDIYTYNSLTECLKHVEKIDSINPVNVYINSGTYDLYEELGGESFLSSITENDTAYTVQPWLYNVNLIGRGNVVLEYNPPIELANQYPLAASLVSPLNIHGNVNIENININCSNCRYAIHDETVNSGLFDYTYHNYKNVNATIDDKNVGSGGYTLGFGFDNGQTYLFENCKFTCNNNHGSLFMHNRESIGANIKIENCILEAVGNYGIVLSNVGIQNKTNVNISSSYINKPIYLRSENTSIEAKNCYQLYLNNCNEISVNLSSVLGTNDYEPIIKNVI